MRPGVLLKSPTYRQQIGRRRLAIACGVVALALASGLIGSLIRPAAPFVHEAATGPFSYFPFE